MNFVKMYIGDYLRDTGTLTVTEHGAYVLMLLHHYATETGLPQGKELHRLLRAETKADREAIDSVCAKFWYAGAEGKLFNKRADMEILKAEHQRDVNRSVGKLGGRPKRIDSENDTEPKPNRLAIGTEVEANHNPNHSQTPDTIKDLSKATPSHPPAKADGSKAPTIPCPYQAIVDRYHEALPMLPGVRLMPTKRQTLMRKAWGWVLSSKRPDGTRRASSAEEALAWFADYFGQAARNDFLTGKTPRSAEHANWECDIDFLLTDRGMKAVIEKTREAA